MTRGHTRLRLTYSRVVVPSLILALALLLAACGGGGDDDIVVTTPTPTPTPTSTGTGTGTPSATPSRTPSPSPTPTATEEPRGEVVQSLRDLISSHGYPSDATYARLRIPTLGVDAQVSERFVGTDGIMPNPVGPAHVVWYDLSAFRGMGGAPGGGGNAIFSGHVDYADNVSYAGIYYRGKGVFAQLHLLSAGDVIEVDHNGQTYRYAVVWRQQLGAQDTAWGQIWSDDVSVDSITLYTCGGEFDFTSREYADRVVVRAERIG